MKQIFSILLLFWTITFTDGQWQIMPSAPVTAFTHFVNVNGILYVSSNGNGVYKTIDSTLTWQQINNGLITMQAKEVLQLLANGTELIAATFDGIYKSSNGGSNWTKKSNGIILGGGALYLFTSSIFSNNGVLFTGAYTGIYRSTDDAENWIGTNISGSGVLANFFVNHNGILFAARESNNQPYGYSSTDNGQFWTPFINNGFPVITYLSEGTILWAGTIDGVWITTNNGLTWSSRNSGLSLDPYSSSIIRVNGTLITSLKFGGSGIYKSTNNGINWVSIGEGLPFLESIDFLFPYGNKILAATSDGIYQRDISEIITSISKQSSEIPRAFKVYQNYPNPFNPSTVIKFDVPVSRDADNSSYQTRLVVYDLLGNEISTLVDETLKPGRYSVTWDASKYPSGAYLYKVQSGSLSETRKMMLIK